MKTLWILTLPFFLIVVLFISRFLSPIKKRITGNAQFDMRETWLDKWLGKVFD